MLAQTKLGILYLNGRGVVRDDSLAAVWLGKAAEQGHAEAQATLALLYQWGRGVPHDSNRAYFWKLLSTDGRDPQRAGELRDLSYGMTNQDIAAIAQRASEWREQHKKEHQPELMLP
jgi:TPR repeat protein